MIIKHLRDEPVPPSRRLGRDLPPDVERLILSCLAKDPAGRPPGAAELSESLGRCEAAEWTQEDARNRREGHVRPQPAAAAAPGPPAGNLPTTVSARS